MKRPIRDSVVVITGASSGIGRATALAFAQEGARLVLAARRDDVLRDLAAQWGYAETLVVPADMSDPDAVQVLAGRAVDHFGRVDTWINNHGVTMFGRFDEVPLEDFRRVIEVNFFGTVHGCRAILPIFEAQQHGVLINMGSMDSLISQPYVSAYVASKHAIRGLSMSLRQELRLKGLRHIHVCTVMPAMIDTPLVQHAANHVGRAAKAMPPVYSPERVAATYVDLAERPRREVIVGSVGRQLWMQSLLAPGATERQLAMMTDRLHFEQDRYVQPTAGNLYQPMIGTERTTGGWGGRASEGRRRLATLALTAMVPAMLIWRLRKRTSGTKPQASLSMTGPQPGGQAGRSRA